MLGRLWALQRTKKYPSLAIIAVNPRMKPTPPILLLARASWDITKPHEVVERCAMARKQDLNEIYRAR